MSRIREEHVHGLPTREAVEHGIAAIGRVVVAAAIIMGTVFAAFILSADRIPKEFGLLLAVAILTDALIVRMTLVPVVPHAPGREVVVHPALARPRCSRTSRSSRRTTARRASRSTSSARRPRRPAGPDPSPAGGASTLLRRPGLKPLGFVPATVRARIRPATMSPCGRPCSSSTTTTDFRVVRARPARGRGLRRRRRGGGRGRGDRGRRRPSAGGRPARHPAAGARTGIAVAEQIAARPDPPAVVLISSRDAAAYGPASRADLGARVHREARALGRGARRSAR